MIDALLLPHRVAKGKGKAKTQNAKPPATERLHGSLPAAMRVTQKLIKKNADSYRSWHISASKFSTQTKPSRTSPP